MKSFKNMPIEQLNISVRTYNCLMSHGISTVEKLSSLTKEQLMRLRNLDKRNYDEILKKLADIGIFLTSEATKELP